MFRRFVDLLDLREATDEEVAAYNAKYHPEETAAQQQQQEQQLAAANEDQDDALSEVSLGSNHFHTVSLSPPILEEAGDYSSAPRAQEQQQQIMVAEDSFNDVALSPIEEQCRTPSPKKFDATAPTIGSSSDVQLHYPQPLPLPTPQSLLPEPQPKRKLSLEDALEATPFRNQKVSFSAFEANNAHGIALETPFPRFSSSAIPSTVKLSTAIDGVQVLRLDESLAALMNAQDAHLNSDLDDQLLKWALQAAATTERSAAVQSPVLAAADWSAPPTPQQEIANARIAELEQALLQAQNASAEQTRVQVERDQAFADLQAHCNQLQDKIALYETQDLVLDFLRAPPSASAQQQQPRDQLLKHCSKLARNHVDDDTQNEGKQTAALAAKVLLLEQQILDEKLVLKNLFLSWMERAERRDAFEILASAFGFTEEDRARLASKPGSWQRASKLGVAWPFSESLADFVRDETS